MKSAPADVGQLLVYLVSVSVSLRLTARSLRALLPYHTTSAVRATTARNPGAADGEAEGQQNVRVRRAHRLGGGTES